MVDLVNISVGAAGGYALLGYAVVFFALVLLMAVVYAMVGIMNRGKRKAAPAGAEIAPPDRSAPVVEPPTLTSPATGTAGAVNIYVPYPGTAAMRMAIVADTMQAPLNELRFIAIRELKEDE